jgi:hypothetical protein
MPDSGYLQDVPRTEDHPQPATAQDAAATALRRERRQAVLDAMAEAAELRARLFPRTSALARARVLLHNRTTRG